MASVTFGPFAFDADRLLLTRNGAAIQLGGRSAALLSALVQAEGKVVSKAELMEAAWPGTIVEEGNLNVQIGALRKALGTTPDGYDWIVTVPRSGYRLPRAAADVVGAPPMSSVAAGDATGPALIAVLPFANLSSDVEQAYFADGVVEDIITALSRFKTFAVTSRNSSFVYRDKSVDVREAAKALGVRYVLEGSVRRVGERVRVTAQLIDGTTGSHIWAEKFDGEASDIFDFQDHITETVVGLIEPQIRKAEIERARRKRPESLDAYDLYLQALPKVYSVYVPGYTEAIDLLDRAIALDPGFAPAVALLAWAHEKRLSFGSPPPGVDDEAITLSLCRRALELGGDDAMVLAIVGWMFIFLAEDYDAGLALARRAVQLNPNSLIALNFAGLCNHHAGDLDEAIALHTRALELSPGAPDNYWSLTGIAVAHMFAWRFEEAAKWAQRSLDTYNEWELTFVVLTASYGHLGRVDEAREAYRQLAKLREGLEDRGTKRHARYPERDAAWSEGFRKAGVLFL
jgi:TolB-like protein/Tfp pilus assembly protein PilF